MQCFIFLWQISHHSFAQNWQQFSLLQFVEVGTLKKYGADKLLEDFVTTVNALQCRGIIFKIGTSETLVHETLVMAPCDTLADQFIGGFKEGVGFAVKPCRTCVMPRKGRNYI